MAKNSGTNASSLSAGHELRGSGSAGPKAALAHDWLNGMRGGEKCLEVFCELYPESPIYTLFNEQGKVSETITSHPIISSRLQFFPALYSHYRYYLPFFPAAIESFDLEGYDLVISTSHCVAKGIRKGDHALHVCYCFTPMRYAWGLFEEYFGTKNPVVKKGIQHAIEDLKRWDLRVSSRVDHFIAISEHIRKRIHSAYQRDADVIYPPVDTDFYTPDAIVKREDFFLIVSALVPYKKIEMAVRAFNELGKKLVVIGDGPEAASMKKLASENIIFMGWQSNETIRDFYRRAKGLVFPGEEDFGIVPVEMQACGGAVIAFGKGGALETVENRRTGIFFDRPSAESLKGAVKEFERLSFDPAAARNNALRFSRQRFKKEMKEKLESLLSKKKVSAQ